MKRQQDRDSPPKSSKRLRSSAQRFEDSPRDGLTPERGGGVQSGGKGGGAPRRHSKTRASSGGETPERMLLMRDDYQRGGGGGRPPLPLPPSGAEYRILCISGINHRVSDVSVREGVFREFKKFGEIDVKLVDDGPERFAYVYFRTPEDAREARHAKSKLVLFDKPVFIEPILEDRRSRRSSLSPDLGPPPYVGKVPRPRGVSPSHSTSSSSSLQRRRRSSVERNPNLPPPIHPHHHHLPPPHHHHHHHDLAHFRPRDGAGGPPPPPLPPLPHPDFLAPHGAPPVLRRSNEEKKEKFPNYLHHIPPEEDDKANRTLFVGNLEVNITEPELRRIFDRYGVVEDIDIKRPPPGQGNAYAFVKFVNLDMAHKSKVELSGQYIGKFQCKIGYGKPVPTTRIWVGGLGPWTSLSHLEKEFDRFGAIKKIDFVKGENHAYILYDSIDAAQEACKEMRGFPLGGPSKRLRVDFADASPYNFHQAAGAPRPTPPPYPPEEDPYYRRRMDHHELRVADPYYYGNSRDPDYARWGAAGYGPEYDAYYDRPPRPRIDGDWPIGAYGDRERHEFGNWGREYGNWREGGNGRDWPAGDQRRKRPRTQDDVRYDDPMASRGPVTDGPYRRYPRQRTPPELPAENSIAVGRGAGGRRRTPSPQRGFRARGGGGGEVHEQDMSPGWKGNAARDRRRSRSKEASAERVDRLSRSRPNIQLEKGENGRPRDAVTDTVSLLGTSGSLLLLEGVADRLVNVSNLSEIGKLMPLTWQGGLVLKNSYFPIQMHACEGNAKLVETLTKDGSSGDAQVLRITQRLRLDQPKLDDVSKRLSGGSFCVLVGLPASSAGDDQTQTLSGGLSVQQRPLRNLVSYLKQKEAAGVIALTGGKDNMQGVLYAFPPCPFSQERLRRFAPGINDDGLKDDHLLIAVVKGGI